MSSSFVSNPPGPLCLCSSPRGSKPPQLRLNLGSISPLRILSNYAFEDLEKHCEHDMIQASDASLEDSSKHLTITLPSPEDAQNDDEICSASCRKDIRPLPPVPSSASTSCPTPTVSPRTRPLPPTPHLKTDEVAISLLQTHVQYLTSPTFTLEYLSPDAALHRRLSKLKRYLGEAIPNDLVPVISSARDPRAAKDLLARLSSFTGLEDTAHEPMLDPTAISLRLKELEDDKSLSDDEHDSIVFVEVESPVEGSDSWSAGGDSAFWTAPLQRYSKKWVREKKGRRQEEQDYAYILRALRSL
ncbi:hypothetical protein J3R30DRAFT_3399468 [Lentinula aciculospora]|uniref:Uncharacterized protein n=1 Tax=Lentinula aciculospora TaxID=153920 RepID=A0A9W9AWD4_9AGAR|nr:hypothetical protein J3R30DRAFT_3399468 [Lentinula aciculospora]